MKKRNIGLEILEGIKEIKEFKEGNKCLVTREMSNSYPAEEIKERRAITKITIGAFPNHKINELTEMIKDVIYDYAPVNGMHYITVIGVLDNIKHQLNKEIEED